MANAKVDVVGQDDIPIVLELYNRIYRPTHDVQFFRRRFLGRYNVLMLVATLDEAPVGFFCGFELKPSVFFAPFIAVEAAGGGILQVCNVCSLVRVISRH